MPLDVSPQADGTIPVQAQKVLLAMGQWLKTNGEAIYGTRPWTVYGEGPTKGKRGGFSEGADKGFTSKDIRFTTTGNILYAIALDWPKEGELLIKSLATLAGRIDSVRFVGCNDAIVWSQQDNGLSVTLPAKKPCDHAFVLKIEGQSLKAAAADDAIQPAADRSLLLEPGAAELHGDQIRTEENHGHEYIAAWDKPADWASWKILPTGKTSYEVRVVCSTANGDTDFVVDLAGQKLHGRAKQTKSWYDYETVTPGKVRIDNGGPRQLVIRVANPAKWKPLNVRDIRLCPIDQ